MRLDRNDDYGGLGKYSLINNRMLRAMQGVVDKCCWQQISDVLDNLRKAGVLQEGTTDDEAFFVMKVKDIYAGPALMAYAAAAQVGREYEYARDVAHLAVTAFFHPKSQKPS